MDTPTRWCYGRYLYECGCVLIYQEYYKEGLWPERHCGNQAVKIIKCECSKAFGLCPFPVWGEPVPEEYILYMNSRAPGTAEYLTIRNEMAADFQPQNSVDLTTFTF